MASRPLKLYWSQTQKAGGKNFGDWLSVQICAHLAKRPIIHAKPSQCDLMAIGSILERARAGWFHKRIHVWGSGYKKAFTPKRAKHHYHAVRGQFTAECLGLNLSDIILGDPGLLAPLLVPAPHKKQFSLGLVPHYVDQTHPALATFLTAHPNTKLIDVFAPVETVLQDIASCDMIAASSLHGLIVADAYHIPNVWLKLSDLLVGGDFKFKDYYSAFNLDIPAKIEGSKGFNLSQIHTAIRDYARPGLAELQAKLVQSFPYPNTPL